MHISKCTTYIVRQLYNACFTINLTFEISLAKSYLSSLIFHRTQIHSLWCLQTIYFWRRKPANWIERSSKLNPWAAPTPWHPQPSAVTWLDQDGSTYLCPMLNAAADQCFLASGASTVSWLFANTSLVVSWPNSAKRLLVCDGHTLMCWRWTLAET